MYGGWWIVTQKLTPNKCVENKLQWKLNDNGTSSSPSLLPKTQEPSWKSGIKVCKRQVVK